MKRAWDKNGDGKEDHDAEKEKKNRAGRRQVFRIGFNKGYIVLFSDGRMHGGLCYIVAAHHQFCHAVIPAFYDRGHFDHGRGQRWDCGNLLYCENGQKIPQGKLRSVGSKESVPLKRGNQDDVFYLDAAATGHYFIGGDLSLPQSLYGSLFFWQKTYEENEDHDHGGGYRHTDSVGRLYQWVMVCDIHVHGGISAHV